MLIPQSSRLVRLEAGALGSTNSMLCLYGTCSKPPTSYSLIAATVVPRLREVGAQSHRKNQAAAYVLSAWPSPYAEVGRTCVCRGWQQCAAVRTPHAARRQKARHLCARVSHLRPECLASLRPWAADAVPTIRACATHLRSRRANGQGHCSVRTERGAGGAAQGRGSVMQAGV